MAVNLNGIDLSGAAANSARKASSAQSSAPSSQEAPQQPPSEVNITSTAALLAQLQQSLASAPAVDQSRVAAISQSLANGTYTVSPGKIAHGLIQSERTLGQLKRVEI